METLTYCDSEGRISHQQNTLPASPCWQASAARWVAPSEIAREIHPDQQGQIHLAPRAPISLDSGQAVYS